MTKQQLAAFMVPLASRRPIFHSEADFQHELAMDLDRAGYSVRLEVPSVVMLNGEKGRMEIDICAIDPSTRDRTAIEVKYVTMPMVINLGGEGYNLRNNWGTNLSRFDCLADYQRVGSLCAGQQARFGFTIFMTNAEDAWAVDAGETHIMAQQFSIHDGRVMAAGMALNWVPMNPAVGSVTRKRLPPYTPITIPNAATCNWTDYSSLQHPNGRFRFLMLAA